MKLIEIIAALVAANLVLTIFNNLKLNQIMAKSQERFDVIIGRLNTITSDIAADYKQLLDAVKDSISEESFAAAEANIAQLEALGASVENPVPEPPVE